MVKIETNPAGNQTPVSAHCRLMCYIRFCPSVYAADILLNARFGILTAMLLKVKVFWDFMMSSWVNTFLLFERVYSLPLQGQTVQEEWKHFLEPLDPEDENTLSSFKNVGLELFTQRRDIKSHKTLTFILLSVFSVVLSKLFYVWSFRPSAILRSYAISFL